MNWLRESEGRVTVHSDFVRWVIAPLQGPLFTAIALAPLWTIAFTSVPMSTWVAVVGAASLITLTRWWLVRLSFDSDTVRITNFWRTYEFSWGELERLEPSGGRFLEWPKFSTLVGFKVRGRRVAIPSTATLLPGRKANRAQLLDRLRAKASTQGVEFDLALAGGEWTRQVD